MCYGSEKICYVIDTTTGKKYVGYCGRIAERIKSLHPILKERIEYTKQLAANAPNNQFAKIKSFEEWLVGDCAAIKAVNNALNDTENDVKLENLFIDNREVRNNAHVPLCKNCQIVLKDCIFRKD